jgi:hypothetical protein
LLSNILNATHSALAAFQLGKLAEFFANADGSPAGKIDSLDDNFWM